MRFRDIIHTLAVLICGTAVSSAQFLINPYAFAAGGGGGGGLSLVASVSAVGVGNAGDPTTSAIDTTGANLIVAAIYYVTGASSLAIVDSASNTWTPLTSRGGSLIAKMYYCAAPTTSGTHTFSLDGNNSFSGIAVAAFSGANASPFEAESGAAATQPGSITPAGDGRLFVTAWGRNDATTLTINSGFTIAQQTAYAPGAGLEVGLAYKIQTTAGAENPTTNTDDGSAMATFKP